MPTLRGAGRRRGVDPCNLLSYFTPVAKFSAPSAALSEKQAWASTRVRRGFGPNSPERWSRLLALETAPNTGSVALWQTVYEPPRSRRMSSKRSGTTRHQVHLPRRSPVINPHRPECGPGASWWAGFSRQGPSRLQLQTSPSAATIESSPYSRGTRNGTKELSIREVAQGEARIRPQRVLGVGLPADWLLPSRTAVHVENRCCRPDCSGVSPRQKEIRS
jgi:hypothetical protein